MSLTSDRYKAVALPHPVMAAVRFIGDTYTIPLSPGKTVQRLVTEWLESRRHDPAVALMLNELYERMRRKE